jgi:hypothetical protein
MSRRKRFTRNLGRALNNGVPKRGTGTHFVRFAHLREPYGVFSYVDEARGWLREEKREELDEIVGWFRAHLDEPACLVPARRRRKTEDEGNAEAICWFRAEAREHVRRARRLAALVRRAGVPIVERWCDVVPGEICSEDKDQLAVASFWT